jgi:hypothetical protein
VGVLPGGNGIEVDGQALDGFADQVDQWVTRGLQPDVEATMTDYRAGTKFGAGLCGASDALLEARKKYQECLEQASVTLVEYISAATIIVNAMKKVRENYGSVDAAAVQNQQTLVDAFAAASAAVAERRGRAPELYASAQVANNHGAHVSTLPGDYQ